MTIVAAFVLIRAASGKVLLLRRSKGESAGGFWALPGGKLRPGESHQDAARRECVEEIGWDPGSVGKFHTRRVKDDGNRTVDATTYLRDVAAEFTPPKMNAEHDAWQWADPDEMLAGEW
jgi:8-oxo-dGTP pyrophosphatase MutT (NUDIX family)